VSTSPGPAAQPARLLRSRRWLLWGALLTLVMLLLGALVFLAVEYEESREQAALEADANLMAGDIRSALLRNVQTLQSLHGLVASIGTWEYSAHEMLLAHREMLRLEWRDNNLALRAHRETPFRADLQNGFRREQFLPDMRQACTSAQRLSGPAFSSSYFLPLGAGQGLEVIEMCLPVTVSGVPNGFMVVTYSMQGLLSELVSKALLRDRGLSLIEADGTRLAIHAGVHGGAYGLKAPALLVLPGHTLMLMLESREPVAGLFPHILTAVVSVLALSLLAVLALLGRDMRRRQRAEVEVADALAFRKAMENSLVTGLRARSMDGRVTYVNPAFCEMVGYPPEQLIGTGLPAPWWPPELVDEYQQRLEVRLAGQMLPREGYESVFQRSDGTRFPVLIIEAPLIDAQGVQTGFMSAILDLTELRRVEDLNRASLDRLQATARLASVGEMASLLSHELNQPLAAISSYASGTLNLLARDGAVVDPADIAPAIQRIGEQAERAGRVIRSVADFVRRRDQKHEPTPPKALIDAIAPLLDLQAKKLGIRVQTRIDPAAPPVVCDRTMVEQVLLNLARNGMQAMPEGNPAPASGLRVLRLGVRRLAGPWVEFSVGDHGHGMSDEVQARLYTPFFTTKPEGMGLGLSLCRTVIEQHGGALAHEPAQPRGTVFRFTLPAALPQGAAPPKGGLIIAP
jgi:two-component system, LuxR family, sensor histidine kinase DctS